MLTKDLLCFRTIKGKIVPKLINTEAHNNLEIAKELLSVFSKSVGKHRVNLEEETNQILVKFDGDSIVARGIEKLLLDRTVFDTESKEEFIKLREKVFSQSSKFLIGKQNSDHHFLDCENNNDQLNRYQNEIAKAMEIPLDQLMQKLYGDLPPFQKILRFRNISTVKLLHRYNIAQVQGLLLRCERLNLILPDNDTAKLRQLQKYLRFNRLLVKISHLHKKEKKLFFEIDGPLSIFVQTNKYGLNLAKFFPAILHQPKWELKAEVRIRKNKIYTLSLDQSCGIQPHYHQFLAYIPEEIEILSRQISKKIPTWTLSPSVDFLNLGGELICFPDYLFTHISGKNVSMELFHSWHSVPLIKRLEQIENQNGAPLLLGVNRSLLSSKKLSDKINASKYFTKFGFFFREVPSVVRISSLLDKWINHLN